MSLFLFGLSHASAPVSVLERATVSEDERVKMVEELIATEHVAEAMIVSTCNRVEIYAAVEAFHPALEAVSGVLGQHSGLSIGEMTQYAYVRYSEAAVEHLFTVAGGLDSMVVGEQQILGQIRASYASSNSIGGVGTLLHGVAQHALRTGKRVHSETGIDKVGASVVSVALDRAQARRAMPLTSAVVLGAGAMGGLAAAYLARHGVADVALLNRTYAKAEHLAANLAKNYGLHAHAESLDDLASVVANADVLIACTGAVGSVVGVGDVHSALTARTVDGELTICDLGLPRDVDPAAARLPGVFVIDIESLAADNGTHPAQADTDAARGIVADELAEYLAGQRQAEVTPTVTALRRRAAEVVEAEMMRLHSRLPDLEDPQRDEVANTVRRVVDKLLHAPTVRVKQLASTPQGDSYAEALRELFELKPGAAESVSAPESDLAQGRGTPGAGGAG